MVRHDNPFTQHAIRSEYCSIHPLFRDNSTGFGQIQFPINDIAKEVFLIFRTNRHEIPTWRGVIPGSKSRRLNSILVLEFHVLSPLRISDLWAYSIVWSRVKFGGPISPIGRLATSTICWPWFTIPLAKHASRTLEIISSTEFAFLTR